ncbi:MAG: phosphotransferase [Planctomycetota bacterium]
MTVEATPDALDEGLRDWLREECGPAADLLTYRGAPPVGRAHLFRIGSSRPGASDATGFYLKLFESRPAFERERDAYLGWLTELEGVPRLVAIAPPPARAVLLSEVPGTRLTDRLRTRADACAVMRAAGEWLRALHSLPIVDRDRLSVPLALRDRMAHALARGAGVISNDDRRWLASRFRNAEGFDGLERVACHRDYQPRNWLVGVRDGRCDTFYVVDFEHTRSDLWLNDIVRLWCHHWPLDAQFETAFLAGYGRQLSEPDRDRLFELALLHAAATIVWAVEHDDEEFEAEGRELLARLRDDF